MQKPQLKIIKGVIMFQIEHISKSYGKKKVLNDVSFPIPEGCAIGILGVNAPGNPRCFPALQKNMPEHQM